MEELKGLDVLEDVKSINVVTRIGDFSFSPIKMGKFKSFATLALPLVNELMDLSDSVGNIVALIEKHEQPLIDLIAIGCDSFSREQYEDLYPDEFVVLVTTLIEVNMDFFVRNLLPKIAGQMETFKAKMGQAKDKVFKQVGLPKSSA